MQNNNENFNSILTEIRYEIKEIKNMQETMRKSYEFTSNKIMSHYIQLTAITDNIHKMVKSVLDQHGNNSLLVLNNKNNVDDNLFNLFNFPLNSIDDITSFNKEISTNNEYKNYLIESYKTIGGTEGQEEGKVVAKKLLGIFFTKGVLMHYSWTGISRTSGLRKKEPFQSLEGILTIFFELILLADSRWNITKNENFFKLHTLKHAKQINKAFEKKKATVSAKASYDIGAAANPGSTDGPGTSIVDDELTDHYSDKNNSDLDEEVVDK